MRKLLSVVFSLSEGDDLRERRSPWLYEPHERPARFALLLYGRLGPIGLSASSALHARKKQSSPSRALVELCAATHHSAILHPNLASGGVATFIHTWNPQEGQFIDGLYATHLAGSRHDPVTDLPNAASHALSISRAARLARSYEVARNHSFDLALALRLDVVSFEPLLLHEMAPGGRTWFARGCCASPAVTREQQQLVSRQCGHGVAEDVGGARRRVVDACRIDHQWKPNARRDPIVETAYHLADWWFAAPLGVALSWGDIALQWEWYVGRARQLRISSHHPKAGRFLWSHQVWPIHVHDAMNLTPTIAFRRWHLTLGRFVFRAGLMVAPGRIGVGDGACNDQAFTPDVLAWHRPAEAAGPPLVPRADLTAQFDGRFAVMAAACPAAHTHGPIACCGRSSHRACGGSQRQHDRACFGTWRSLQLALGGLNRSALLADSYMRDTIRREHSRHKYKYQDA